MYYFSIEIDYIVSLHFDALYKVHVRYERSNGKTQSLKPNNILLFLTS